MEEALAEENGNIHMRVIVYVSACQGKRSWQCDALSKTTRIAMDHWMVNRTGINVEAVRTLRHVKWRKTL